jgi:hypothetical protein
MARPTKQGIDYFPLDVDLDKDDKLQMIIAEYGYKGEAIYTKLCAWIYKHQGYFIEWSEMEQLKFANRVSYILGGAQVNLINQVIARCVRWGLFDKSLFDMSQILTSKRIQETWWEATRKRKERDIEQQIWLLTINDGLKAEETQLTTEVINKVNESKVKESKEEKHEPENPVPPAVVSQDPVIDLEKEYKLVAKEKREIFLFIRDSKPQFIEPYADFWNIFAAEHTLPKLTTINKKRKQHFSVRIKEPSFNFPEILRKAKTSDFLLTGRWFGFDWIVQNDTNYLKVLEGNYDNKKMEAQRNATSTNEEYHKKRKALAEQVRQRAED